MEEQFLRSLYCVIFADVSLPHDLDLLGLLVYPIELNKNTLCEDVLWPFKFA